MANVVLIDAGGTNIGSVRYALQRLGVDAPLSSNADEIRAATHVILPGVGAAAPGMQRLRETGLVDVVRGLTQPVLGVCLGMQLLFEHSEESDTPCLGLIPASLQLFAKSDALRVPHMGWNSLQIQRASPLLAGIDAGAFAYFVHSYAASVGDYTLASYDYGGAFSAVVQRGNFYGAQFHPERSAAVGARLLENFIKL
ncbi:imidazole glycerol phosphate synthase subunit HisH [Rudaea cellulosilytica]|uniref:imidazole glycerol phosphate synthase subunit HisH n=1 Tax=Rudaea cellulosilytica TaxID=540746 RepID=UPI0003774690|nr:imidazole glycerol phosphate synthase subunit HisH [Rudaea cellulosilytica]